MVTVAKNPIGHKIIDQPVEATVTDSGGDLLISYFYHNLTTGAFVYIDSVIDEYNGFWYVTVIDPATFKISESAFTDFVEFYQEIDLTYYQTQAHDWSSIFLPIIYKCTNDRWPVNTVDTAKTISSFADDNGFTELVLSGDIRAGVVNQLEFVKITGATEQANGLWQIVEVISNSNIVINLPYDAANVFTMASIQYYYNNYQVKIKVFSGLNATHPWAAQKPYEEVAELSLTPDDNNEVMFSISDYIKTKVNVRNNLLLFSLPLNLDAFTGFYIQTGESFDQSDNYTLYTSESDFTTDSFEGYAIAGKLPFKNVYSGDYSDYVTTSGQPALWLTNISRLLAVEDRYFDISFIKNLRGPYWIIIDKYVSDYLTVTEVITYDDLGIGVYRVPIIANATYDSFCIRAYTPGTPASDGPPVTTLANEPDWVNLTFGWLLTAYDWTITVNGSGGPSGYLAGAIITTAGFDYEFTTQIEIEDFAPYPILSQVTWVLMDSSNNIIDSQVFNYDTPGVKNETFTLTSSVAGAKLALIIVNNTPFASKNYHFISAEYNAPAAPDDSVEAQTLTQEICIDMMANCDVEELSEEEFRLLEDSFFRLLEDDEFRLLE